MFEGWYGMVQLEEHVGSNCMQVCGLENLEKKVMEVKKNHIWTRGVV